MTRRQWILAAAFLATPGVQAAAGQPKTRLSRRTSSPPRTKSTVPLVDLDWNELDSSNRFALEEAGHTQLEWDSFGKNLRWYYVSTWDELSQARKEGLQGLGWTQAAWKKKHEDGYCIYERPLVELRSFSRMLPAERAAARKLGFNKYTWHTKEFEMVAWPEKQHVNKNLTDIVTRIHDMEPAVLLPNNGFTPIPLTLNISEFAGLTLDRLAQVDEVLIVEDPYAEKAAYGNDESPWVLTLTAKEFVQRIRDGKPYYIKYEDDDQDAIASILQDLDPAEVMTRYLMNTPVGDLARLGPKYAEDKDFEQIVQLYVGGTNSITNMHLDIMSFNFLYVVSGRKRVRLLPNDQRYAKNFTWGLEAAFSVWTGYDLLHEPLPEDGVELILGPGQGVAVPYMTWHAVENLEPSIALGLIRDFPYTGSSKMLCGGSFEKTKATDGEEEDDDEYHDDFEDAEEDDEYDSEDEEWEDDEGEEDGDDWQ